MAIFQEINMEKTVLKYFDYKASVCVIDENTTGVKTVDGKKVLKGGTPYPSNDASCLGYLLHDYDVTNGPVEAAYVFEGTIDPEKLTANEVEVADTAKTATPRVTFYGEAHE